MDNNSKKIPKEVLIEYSIKTLIAIAITTSISWFVIDYTITSLTSGFVRASKTRIDAVDKGYGGDKRLLCLISDCSYLEDKKTNTMLKTDNFLEFSSHKLPLVKEDFLTFDSKDYTIYTGKRIGPELRTTVFYNVVVFITLFIVLCSAVGVFFKSIWVRRKKIIESKEIESSVQQQLTESLHHEVGGPLTVVECNLSALMETIVPCEYISGQEICNQQERKDDERCKKCDLLKRYQTPLIKEQLEYYTNVKTNIETIKEILRIVSNSKHLRYTNGNVSITTLLESLVSSRRFTNFNLMPVSVNNLYALENYSLNGDISNATLTNVLHALLNNAFEAHSNKVIITVELDERKENANLYIQDNGHGLRNSKGGLVTNPKDFNKFFKYGFSTKDAETNTDKKWNLVNILLNSVFGNIHDVATTRGAGLAINRNLMRYASGDLYIKSTSEKGTCFVITFPVVKKKDSKIKVLQ